jgi:lipopolysaccharide heptosyltransferase II
MDRAQKWNDIKNLLCIRMDNLGDVLMTSPALKALKEGVPGRKITLLASRAGSGIAGLIPVIDEVMVSDPLWEKNEGTKSSVAVEEIIAEIRSRSFDAAVIFTVYSQNPLPAAMLCYLAGIPAVAGYCRENPYHLIPDWLPDPEPLECIRHEVERQLALVKALGASAGSDDFVLDIPDTCREALPDRLRSKGLDMEKPWLVVHPGVSEKKRQYPPELFAEVIRGIREEMDFQVVLTGVPSEKELTDSLAARVPDGVFSMSGELSLGELAALLREAPLLISNNSGPVHIAAAVKTPVVVLYALTNPQHTPWKTPSEVLYFDVPEPMRSKNAIVRYAYEKAFTQFPETVEPGRVVEAAKKLLSRHRFPAFSGIS